MDEHERKTIINNGGAGGGGMTAALLAAVVLVLLVLVFVGRGWFGDNDTTSVTLETPDSNVESTETPDVDVTTSPPAAPDNQTTGSTD